jgi:hypothetical protein
MSDNIQDQINFEIKLSNQRFTWLLALQSILLVPYVNITVTTDHNSTLPSNANIMAIKMGILFAAQISLLLISFSVATASNKIRILKRYLKESSFLPENQTWCFAATAAIPQLFVILFSCVWIAGNGLEIKTCIGLISFLLGMMTLVLALISTGKLLCRWQQENQPRKKFLRSDTRS